MANERMETIITSNCRSETTVDPTKPAKPTPDFPLFAHSRGYWAKKVKGKTRYFGPWSDPAGALAKYEWEFAAKADSLVLVAPSLPARPKRQKPAKPDPDFPLYAHSGGQWAKKIKGKMRYFGTWANPEAALAKYLAQRADLLAGRIPRPMSATPSGPTMRKIVNWFLNSKRLRTETGELTQATFGGYYDACKRTILFFGADRPVSDLRPDDFEGLRGAVGKKLNATSLGNFINRVRILFKYAHDQDLIDRPIRYGQSFKRPSAKAIRVERNKKGSRMFEADQLHAMLKEATRPMKAMILLGMNCGFGNNDCATLPIEALDLKRGWLDYPRPKTAVLRWSPLWPETVEALREVLAKRREPAEEYASLVFITKRGLPWSKATSDNPVTKEMVKLLKKLKFNRPGLGFYALRHTFLTIAEGCRDQKAVEFIMGHAPEARDMSAHYREEFAETRLRHVTDHVHKWLFAKNTR